MTATLQLTAVQRDAMREVANIASGHAATALGELTARRVMIAVPQLTFAPVGDIPALLGYTNQRVVVVAMKVLGDLSGTLLFLMAEHKARELSGLLLSQEMTEGSLDELAQSSLMETANILGGAYTGALATLKSGIVMLSVPVFGIEPPDGILEKQRPSSDHAMALLLETTLKFENETSDFGAHLVFLPGGMSLRLILDSLDVPAA